MTFNFICDCFEGFILPMGHKCVHCSRNGFPEGTTPQREIYHLKKRSKIIDEVVLEKEKYREHYIKNRFKISQQRKKRRLSPR